MRSFALLACAILVPSLSALAGDISAKTLAGTWVWSNHRHDVTITYRVDGTYSRESQFANETKPRITKGQWRIEGNNLVETDSQKGSEPVSSVIGFINKDKFELDGFMLYERIPDAEMPQEKTAIPD
jgi:hypothetical protein